MIRRTFALPVLALALAGCATHPAGYADGSYTGAYNGGYYAAAGNGNGDYYYDRPEVVVNEYGYPGFGYGYSSWGFGYGPWFGGPWWGCGYHRCGGYGWHHTWPRPGVPWPHSLPAHAAARTASPHSGSHPHSSHFSSHGPKS